MEAIKHGGDVVIRMSQREALFIRILLGNLTSPYKMYTESKKYFLVNGFDESDLEAYDTINFRLYQSLSPLVKMVGSEGGAPF